MNSFLSGLFEAIKNRIFFKFLLCIRHALGALFDLRYNLVTFFKNSGQGTSGGVWVMGLGDHDALVKCPG